MEGYEGVESLVYKALAKVCTPQLVLDLLYEHSRQVMEQIEGGDLVVNKGHESKPREKAAERNLNAVEGLETAFRLAEVNQPACGEPHAD